MRFQQRKYFILSGKSAKFLSIISLYIILIFSFQSIKAKHLVGGSVTYKFIEVTGSGLYHYRITVDMFRDCLDPQAPLLDTGITLGFYEAKGTSPVLANTLSISRVSLDYVNPVAGGSQCSFVPNTCLQHGIYIADAFLPASNYGYYMQYARCCRNSINNITDNSGYNYWGFISPTKYENTSPAFNDVPVPYICANDTVSLNFSASEPDGDSITYTLAQPYSGAANGNPNPTPPYNYSDPSLSLVSYLSNYSYDHPFGKYSYCTLDVKTGLLRVNALNIGRYAVAIDYIEYRNGVQINRTRRDVQFIVISCPYNPAPVRQYVNGSQPTSYYAEGGSSFNFNVQFSDPNSDSVTLSATGPVFQKSPNNAVFKTLPSSNPSVQTGTFTWNTTCKDISSQPYLVYIKAQDHGCPPKSTLQPINLYVKPPASPDSIFGPTVACGISDTFTYFAYHLSGTSLQWKVTGGKIISKTKNDTIRVVWNSNSLSGKIKVVAINSSGCAGDTLVKSIRIVPIHLVSQIIGPAELCVDQKVLYSITGAGLYARMWGISEGIFWIRTATTATVFFTKPGKVFLEAVVSDSNGCSSDTIKFWTKVEKPVADSIYGSASVCPNSHNIDYFTKFQQGSKYYWTVTGGVQSSGGNTNHITVNWGNKGAGMVKVFEITSAGCMGDTVSYNVLIDYKLITPSIRGDSVICENSPGHIYQVYATHNSTYSWKVTGGTLVSGQGSGSILVNWGKAGSGLVEVQQTAYDSVNNQACIAAPVSLAIKIDSTPNTSAISGNTIACPNSTNSYRVKGFWGSGFAWNITPQGPEIFNQGHDSIGIVFTNPGSYTLTVIETSKDSCQGWPQVLHVYVDSIPNTGEISGPRAVCSPDFSGKSYSVRGETNSTFNWQIEGGKIVSGNGTQKVIVNWNRLGTGKLSVTETSAFGCSGPERSIFVKVDSLGLMMDLVTTSRENDMQIELHWHTVDGEFLKNDIMVFRSIDPLKYGYRQAGTVPATANTFIDKNVSTHNRSYYYKIEALNSCGDVISSAPHRTILLENDELRDTIIQMYWNSYKGWPGGVDKYHIYKSENSDTSLVYYNTTTDSNAISYTDLVGYKQCYRVSAIESGNPNMISWSNNICVNIDPEVWIPDVFTPNNDNHNNTWRVVVTNMKAYKADVYNRWGEHIFSTTDPKIQWDGKFQGADCPEGVYLYMIQVDGIRKNIFRNGTLQLLR
jgi:gliding motility-associated-like protein